MSLFSVEVRRLLARRLFRVSTLLLFAALALTFIEVGGSSRPPTSADAATMDFLLDTFVYRQWMADLVGGFGVVLAVFGFLVGASFIGAEWSAGTLPALLTWEPRRPRVFAAKAAALASIVAAVGVAVMAVHLAGFYGLATWRGSVAGVTPHVVGSLMVAALRSVALGVAAALAGFGLAALLRSTAGALGVGFAYFVVGELALRLFWQGADAWLLSSNAAAFLFARFEYFVEACRPGGGACHEQTRVLSVMHGGLYVAVLLAVILLGSGLWFRRRDVT